MMALGRLMVPNHFAAQWLDLLQPLLALATRLHVGWVFFKSGLHKIGDWEQTIALFENEYRTPILSPVAAAVLGACGELALPIFLWLGLYGRLSAVGLSVVNAVAVISYAHVLLAAGFEGAIAQHKLWAFMLAMLAIYGPGKLSLDYWLSRRVLRVRGELGATVTV